MSHHVLLLGGHGKIAQLLTPLLLRRGWTVTSTVRVADEVPEVQALARKGGGDDAGGRESGSGSGAADRLHVLVHSLEDVPAADNARALLARVRPDYVVFSAGAGGRGATTPDGTLTRKIDHDAAIAFVQAAAATPFVTRFLLVSHQLSRRRNAPWWDPLDWHKSFERVQANLATYYAAKLPPDEELYRVAKAAQAAGRNFVAISLRPGTLTDGPAGGVALGRTAAPGGSASRATVARVADLLLANPQLQSGWMDLLDGTEDIEAAVDRVVLDGYDTAEGEPVTKE